MHLPLHPCELSLVVFFFADAATTELSTLSLHDALPILTRQQRELADSAKAAATVKAARERRAQSDRRGGGLRRADVGSPTGVDRRSGRDRRGGRDRRSP